MRFFRPGLIGGLIYPEAVFRIKTRQKLLVLTFDDGPDPASTPVILQILDRQNVKAIFFCSGTAASESAGLIRLISERGCITGNHGSQHLDGWRTSTTRYVEDIRNADLLTSSHIFRPPFGHLSLKQYRELKKKYKIVFWDIMPYDFDREFGSRRSLKVLKKMIRPGSIIVLHDTCDSSSPEFLEEFILFARDRGYEFVIDLQELYSR